MKKYLQPFKQIARQSTKGRVWESKGMLAGEKGLEDILIILIAPKMLGVTHCDTRCSKKPLLEMLPPVPDRAASQLFHDPLHND